MSALNVLGRLFVVLSFGALVGCTAKTAYQAAAPEGAALIQFREAVDAYVVLQRQQLAGAAAAGQKDSEDITDAARHALAERIRVARTGARQGDIFGPAVAKLVRHALDSEVRGKAAAGTRASIRDDGPGGFSVSVNMHFPAGPLPTMPPNVLRVLPSLPEGLDYRIVQTNLILRDTVANLVVDYLPDVMCKAC